MTPATPRPAPGHPGIPPRWTSSAKSAVGTAFGDGSRVWFTASHGILNEIYHPEVDTACVRDAGFLISDDRGYFAEEKRDCSHRVDWAIPGVPAFRFRNASTDGRFEIEKHVCASPEFDAVLQHVELRTSVGSPTDYHLTLLVASHLGNRGAGNTAWVGSHKGFDVLYAERAGRAMAVVCSTGWTAMSVGFVGVSDGWREVREHGRLLNHYTIAADGNVALAGEVDLSLSNGRCTIAIGFGPDPESAAFHARAALAEPYERVERRFMGPWVTFQNGLRALDEVDGSLEVPSLYRTSTAVLMSHLTMNADGGAIASLSVPWGQSKGDDDLGGYHLVWPRDMVQTAGALLAAGAHEPVRAMLRYLAVTQEADGHWAQNMWLNGEPYWNGIQLDETALPILLIDLAHREECIALDDELRWWPVTRRAALYLVEQGPATQQDRWEEDPGYTPFSLASCIAALVVAASVAERVGEPALAQYLRDTADDWYDRIDRWIYVTGTPLAADVGVRGYYVRGARDDGDGNARIDGAMAAVKNRPADATPVPVSSIVSPDALALVRFGLRMPDDQRMIDTARVIDYLLRTETPTGPVWHRYNEDGYGEHDDGRPFDGTGKGRGWPLLAGERAHYELALGRLDRARDLGVVMRRQASDGGMLPEQVWDAPDLVDLELFTGRASGSAMPLAWAHAEYIKLLRSLRDGRVFDLPPAAATRYLTRRVQPRVAIWRFTLRRKEMTAGRLLRLDLGAPARVRWTMDAWTTSQDSDTQMKGPRHHSVELPTQGAPPGTRVEFTFHWLNDDRWEGKDFAVDIVKSPDEK
ncbi:MAG: glycoside hydrolase family 15 protein [Gemmatimonadaceae bacterium]